MTSENAKRRRAQPGRGRGGPPRPGQVGRRPPQPLVPLVTGLMWIIVGVVILIWLTASWKYVAGIVVIGVGVLFARGGLAALIRQTNRRADD